MIKKMLFLVLSFGMVRAGEVKQIFITSELHVLVTAIGCDLETNHTENRMDMSFDTFQAIVKKHIKGNDDSPYSQQQLELYRNVMDVLWPSPFTRCHSIIQSKL